MSRALSSLKKDAYHQSHRLFYDWFYYFVMKRSLRNFLIIALVYIVLRMKGQILIYLGKNENVYKYIFFGKM